MSNVFLPYHYQETLYNGRDCTLILCVTLLRSEIQQQQVWLSCQKLDRPRRCLYFVVSLVVTLLYACILTTSCFLPLTVVQ